MLRTKIGISRIAGIGLFANEYVLKGGLVWKFVPGFDALFTESDVCKLSEPAKFQFRNYAFLDKTYGLYMLCADDARFFNHSLDPNCDDSMPDITTAIRDITPGEELTVDYGSFYGDLEAHPEISLTNRFDQAEHIPPGKVR